MKSSGFIKYIFLLAAAVLFTSCGEKPDAIYTNGKIYTMNTGNSVFEAMAVKEEKFWILVLLRTLTANINPKMLLI